MKLYNIYKELIIESVNRDLISDIINKRTRATLFYDDGDDNGGKGKRTVDIYAYGTSKAGNQIIRAYQPFGDTTSKSPSWKLFRVDRIQNIKPTGYIFQKAIEGYNPQGDESMIGQIEKVSFPTDNERAQNQDLSRRKADAKRRTQTDVGSAKDSFTKGQSYDEYTYNSKNGYTDPNQMSRPEDDEYEIEDIESDEVVDNADEYYPTKDDNEEFNEK